MELERFQQEVMNAQESTRWTATAFPALMRKVYVWMTLALAITGFTAYSVANSPAILQMIFTNKLLFFGIIIAELALVWGVSAAINRLSLTTATLLFVLYSVYFLRLYLHWPVVSHIIAFHHFRRTLYLSLRTPARLP